MNFELTEQQKLLRSNARSFLEREVMPIADEHDRKRSLSKEKARELVRKLIPLGYIAGLMPEKYGGQGLDHVSYGVLIEELGRAWASLAFVTYVHTLLAERIEYVATEEQKQRLLPPMLSLERMGCTANTEPDAGSNIASIQTTADLDGDELVINGTKTWSSGGTFADYCLLLAVTDKSKGTRGLSFIFVDKEVSPFTTRDLPTVGLRSHPISDLFFENCRVPRGNLLGEPDTAYKKLLTLWQSVRCWLSLIAVGLAQAAIDASVQYVRQRHQFGKPIGSFQLVQEMIADMVISTEAARLLIYRALSLVGQGVRCPQEVALAKVYATEGAVSTTSKAIQLHGAYGLSEEYPLERYFRDARMLTIPDGTTQIQKLIIGREVLGLSAFS